MCHVCITRNMLDTLHYARLDKSYLSHHSTLVHIYRVSFPIRCWRFQSEKSWVKFGMHKRIRVRSRSTGWGVAFLPCAFEGRIRKRFSKWRLKAPSLEKNFWGFSVNFKSRKPYVGGWKSARWPELLEVSGCATTDTRRIVVATGKRDDVRMGWIHNLRMHRHFQEGMIAL